MSHFRNAVAVVSVIALGGCQFFGNLHLAHNSSARPLTAAAIANATERSSIQEGREHLRGGRIGLAIEAFNRALAASEDPALAYNGLGVAYARLGRPELAYRLFNKAIMSNPSNPIFAHNLANLVNSSAFTLDQMTRLPPALATAPQAFTDLGTAAFTPERAPGKLYRDGDRQFRLVTVVPDQARAVPGERSALLGNCARSTSMRVKHQCRTAPLPIVKSRPRQPALTAFNQAFPNGQMPIAALADHPADAPTGKRRTVDFSSQPRPTPQQHTPQQSGPAIANSKT